MARSGKVAEQRDPGVVAWIDRELDKLEAMAKEVANRFWKYHYESRVEANLKEWCVFRRLRAVIPSASRAPIPMDAGHP